MNWSSSDSIFLKWIHHTKNAHFVYFLGILEQTVSYDFVNSLLLAHEKW